MMKPSLTFLAAALVGAAGAMQAAETTAGAVPPVQVKYFEPENFRDAKDDFVGTEKGREHVLARLQEHLQERAAKYLPPGGQLHLTITDVDLAGEYEPWTNVRFQDVRVVKSIYPPALALAFKLLDANGEVLKQGERTLRDLGFQMGSPWLDRHDALRYEKEMIDQWLRAEFGPRKKG